MWRVLTNIYRLGIKELFSLRYDLILVVLIVYSFTYAIYGPAKNASFGMINATVGIVDEDNSALSRSIADAFRLPEFLPPGRLNVHEIDQALDQGQYTFVIDIPSGFSADVARGRRPSVQIIADATAMTQAGSGVGYAQSIIAQKVAEFTGRERGGAAPGVSLVTRTKFNPNLDSSSFMAVMQIVNNITMLAMFLSGAAIIREREHGTIEHLLVMPVTPTEIMLAKVWANGLVIVLAAGLSLKIVVEGLLGLPVAGSVPLFMFGVVIYLFSITSMGIFLGTVTRTMPQFALLAFPVLIVMNLLSGGNTPMDSMPPFLQWLMQLSPSTQFVSFAQAILYRGAGLDIVWREFSLAAGLGAIFFTAALMRFRKALAA